MKMLIITIMSLHISINCNAQTGALAAAKDTSITFKLNLERLINNPSNTIYLDPVDNPEPQLFVRKEGMMCIYLKSKSQLNTYLVRLSPVAFTRVNENDVFKELKSKSMVDGYSFEYYEFLPDQTSCSWVQGIARGKLGNSATIIYNCDALVEFE